MTTESAAATGDPLTQEWVCTVCGWIYDPQTGDPERGVPPGTAFGDLPVTWVCPKCWVDQDMFRPYYD